MNQTLVSELSAAEQQLMSIVWRFKRDGKTPDRVSLDRFAYERLGAPLDWDGALPRLLQLALIQQDGDCLVLTAQGEALRVRAERAYPFIAHMYDAFYARAAVSRAHATFCEQVYGRDLCQHGAADMVQVDALIGALDIRSGHRVLDLGCGIGMISEYIADVTGAQVTGIDASRVGIQHATSRTRPKREHLEFREGNLNVIELPQATFDAVLLIDTIYFLERDSVIRRARAALKPGGQVALFYSHWWAPGTPPDAMHPDTTDLAKLLQRCALSFAVREVAAMEDDHWQLKLDVLAALRTEFEAEGNMWLHGFRRREAEGYFARRQQRACSRYQFRAWRGRG